MSDAPGRAPFEADGRAGVDDGAAPAGEWGSPLPAEYGSLSSLRQDRAGREDPAPEETSQRGLGERLSATSLMRRLQGPPPADTRRAEPRRAETTAGPQRPPEIGTPSSRRGAAPAPAGPREAAPSPTLTEIAGPTGIADGEDVAEAPGPVSAAAAEDAGWSDRPEPTRTAASAYRRGRRRPVRVRARATLRHVDVLSVLKVSIVFYLVVMIAFVVASLFLWTAANAFGVLPSLDKSVRTLFSLKTFQLHAGPVALYTALIGAVISIAGTFANVLLALVYNLINDSVGGIRVELESVTRD